MFSSSVLSKTSVHFLPWDQRWLIFYSIHSSKCTSMYVHHIYKIWWSYYVQLPLLSWRYCESKAVRKKLEIITNTVVKERFDFIARSSGVHSNWRRGWDGAGHFLGQCRVSQHQQMRVHVVQGLIDKRQFPGLALGHAVFGYQRQVGHSQHQSRHSGLQ